ncbi:MAG: polysaccharide biosynthesis C-terminal domain-containing protein [Flavobacteriales bacterium]
MGVIQRQGIKNSIVNYIGVGFGFIATLYIYPFDLEAKGLIEYLMGLVALFIPYSQIGYFAVYQKYFPNFENQKSEFQGWILKKLLIHFLIFLAVFFALRGPLSEFLFSIKMDPHGNFLKYSLYIPPLIFLILCQGYFTVICNINKRIVIPDLIRNVIQKIYFPTIVVLKFSYNISNENFLLMVLGYYLFTIPLLFWYVKKNNFLLVKWKSKLTMNKELKKEITSFNSYSLLNDLSTQLTFKLDAVMLGSIVSITTTGIYSIMIFVTNALSIPSISILRISAPIIAEYMAKNEIKEVESLYKKVSLTQVISGIILFLVIWFLLSDLLSLTKYSEQLKVGIIVFFILALGRIFDMITSINTHILIYSKYFRYNLLFVIFLGCLNIFLNVWLIPIYGMKGAAIATLTSSVIYNILKLFFIYWKLKIHPFSSGTLKVVCIGIISYFILNLLPTEMYLENPFLNLILKGSIVGSMVLIAFVLPVYFLKISPDINSLIDKLLVKFKILKK